jgi:hypothetical protein
MRREKIFILLGIFLFAFSMATRGGGAGGGGNTPDNQPNPSPEPPPKPEPTPPSPEPTPVEKWEKIYGGSRNLLWEKVIGGGNEEVGYSIRETSDGGFLAASHYDDHGGDVFEVVLDKLDRNGNLLWEKRWPGLPKAMKRAHGGGFVIPGATVSVGSEDYFAALWKIDEEGNLLWQKTFSQRAMFNHVEKISGGYILADIKRRMRAISFIS